jgi:hypothetical protein
VFAFLILSMANNELPGDVIGESQCLSISAVRSCVQSCGFPKVSSQVGHA